LIASLQNEQGRIVDWSDTTTPGLVLRITPTGGKKWVVSYRSPVERDLRGNGKQRRYGIGTYPQLDLKSARDKARAVLRQIGNGEDPHTERRQNKAQRTALPRDPVTVADGIQLYIDEHIKIKNKPRLKANGGAVWERANLLQNHVVSGIGNMQIADVTRKDVLSLQRRIEAKAGSVTAERAVEGLRAAFNWLDDNELFEGIPSLRLKHKVSKMAASRDRILNDREIRTIWAGLDNGLFGSIVRILLLTGQRRSEVGDMLWSELDLEKQLWSLPGDRTKNGRPHLVPLSSLVVEILKKQPSLSPFVFTSTGTTPFSGYSRSKERLDRRLKILHWTLHDLRRTFVTRISEMGVAPQVVEAIVNHVTGQAKVGVAGIYNRALYMDERRSALDAWSLELEAVVRNDGE
jgi:integrase